MVRLKINRKFVGKKFKSKKEAVTYFQGLSESRIKKYGKPMKKGYNTLKIVNERDR